MSCAKYLLRTLPSFLLAIAAFSGERLLAGDVVLNEIHYDPPDRTKLEEFVELYNGGAAAVDLSGWYFSSGIRYTFPEGTVIQPGAYMVVALNPDSWRGRMLGEPLGPFEGYLSSQGERVILRNSDGDVEDEVDYKVAFPWPTSCAGDGGSMELIHPSLENDLGGSWRASAGSSTLPEDPIDIIVEQDTQWHLRKGTSEASDPPSAWREIDFVEDGTWSVAQTCIGYADDDDITVLGDMQGGYSSVFLRHTFTLPPGMGAEDPADFPPKLVLRLYVDDGCIAWINGVEVARAHMSSGDKAYDDLAQGHEAAWEEVSIDNVRGFLRQGQNVLAIHAFNQTLNSSDFSIDAALLIPSKEGVPATPTPGERNSVYAENAPPQIRQVQHYPDQPLSGQTIPVTAKVTDPDGVASVKLRYQVVLPGSYVPALLALPVSQLLATPLKPRPPNPAFEDPASWTEIPMADDGKGADELAGDGVYACLIPAQANRSLVRYRISVADVPGALATVPYADDGSLNFACFVYDGVPPYVASKASVHPDGPGHVYETDVMEILPVYFLLTKAQEMTECLAYNSSYQIPKGNEAARDAFNWEGAFVYEGIVYDHVTYRLRQANDRYGGAGKRSFRIRFHRGRYLEARDNWGNRYPTKWRTLNVGKMFDNLRVGNFGITEEVNAILWNLVDVPAPYQHTFHWRVIDGRDEVPAGVNGQYYGDFWGMFTAVEDYDPRFLDAHGLPDGNLYKLKDGIFTGNDLKRNQGRYSVTTDADFQNIRNNLRPTQTAAWLNQHVRYEKWYPYHTVVEAIRHYDFVPADSHSKNRAWFFEPSEGTPFGLLWTLPHDADASWGPNWNSGIDYSTQAIATGADKAPFRQAYRNVIREFRDLLWREDVLNPMIDRLALVVLDFSYADRDRWRNAPADAGSQDYGTLEWKVQDMKNFAFKGWTGSTGPAVPAGGRAAYLDSLSKAEGDGTGIPQTPTVTAVNPADPGTPPDLDALPIDRLVFDTTPFSDPQGDGTFGRMKWRVAEVADPKVPRPFWEPPLYEWTAAWESGEIDAFSSRVTVPPSAVQIGHTYRVRVRMTDATGKAGHWSEPVEFTAGAPTSPIAVVESLRVTEIMYHPLGDSDFEYIELQNVGAEPVDLRGIQFTEGVKFSFEESGITTLGPGEFVVVVKDPAVFASRYQTLDGAGQDGPEIAVAGAYTGNLDNQGERIVLALGNLPIQEFTYLDAWYPATDGLGYSLVPVDPKAPREDWTRKEGWRPSVAVHGSPGRADVEEPPPGGLIAPGDANRDGRLDISDPVTLLGHMFLGNPPELPCGEGGVAAEANLKLTDMNGDSGVNLTDAIYALQYLFQGGSAPALGEQCVRIVGCPEVCAE